MEPAENSLAPGTVVWGRVKGYPWWPALVVPYELVLFLPPGAEVPAHEPGKIVLQFFSDGRISLLRLRDVQLYVGNEELVHGAGQYSAVISAAAEAAQAWLAMHGARPPFGGKRELEEAREGMEGARREAVESRGREVAARHEVQSMRLEIDETLREIESMRGLVSKAEMAAEEARREMGGERARVAVLAREVRRLRGGKRGREGEGDLLGKRQITAKLRVCKDLIGAVLKEADGGGGERKEVAKKPGTFVMDEDADEEEDSDEPVFVK